MIMWEINRCRLLLYRAHYLRYSTPEQRDTESRFGKFWHWLHVYIGFDYQKALKAMADVE